MTPPIITPAQLTLSQIVLAVFTILSSGVIAATVTFRLNSRKAEREFLRTKLEALYIAAARFTESLFITYAPLIPVIAGSLSYKQAKEAVDKVEDADSGNAFRDMEMLINIYFPDLTAQFDDVLDSRNVIGSTVLGPAMIDRLPADRGSLAKEFDKDLKVFQQRSEALRQAICQKGRQLSGIRKLAARTHTSPVKPSIKESHAMNR